MRLEPQTLMVAQCQQMPVHPHHPLRSPIQPGLLHRLGFLMDILELGT